MYIVYGKPDCPWCDATKQFLNQNNISYSYHEVGTDLTREEFLIQFPDQRTVPLILDESGHKIGGYVNLRKYLDPSFELP